MEKEYPRYMKYENEKFSEAAKEDYHAFQRKMSGTDIKSYLKAYKYIGYIIFTIRTAEEEEARKEYVINASNPNKIKLHDTIENEKAIAIIMENLICKYTDQIIIDRLMYYDVSITCNKHVEGYNVLMVKSGEKEIIIILEERYFDNVSYEAQRKCDVSGKYRILRFTEREVYKETLNVMKMILKALNINSYEDVLPF